MSDDEVDWRQYLADFHRDRAGVVEAVLSRVGGRHDHTPYRWLARAVSAAPPDRAGRGLRLRSDVARARPSRAGR